MGIELPTNDHSSPSAPALGSAPGRNLAMLEANCALAAIGRDFELELDESGSVEEFLGFVMAPRGLKMHLRERVPAERSTTADLSTPP